MNVERYEYQSFNSHFVYLFISDGPNDKIRKFVAYTPRNVGGITYFNLGFGDLNEETGFIDDLAVSDNKDTQKILGTIAAIVLEFTEKFPDLQVYVQGSTPARTRLYQMGIIAHWHEIEPLLLVYGLENNVWKPFEKNVKYDAFLAKRK